MRTGMTSHGGAINFETGQATGGHGGAIEILVGSGTTGSGGDVVATAGR
jgi:hypothetical protein